MILNLITLDTIKDQLGISDGTYDSALTAIIPQVSNDIRRILNNNFDFYIPATLTSGSNVCSLYLGTQNEYYSGKIPLQLGQVIYHPNLPLDTYIVSYDPEQAEYTLSASATGDGEYIYLGLEIGQWSAVSKMALYRVNNKSTSVVDEKKIKTIRYGNVSKTFSDDEINKQFDYPQVFLNDLGKPNMKVI
jgi:hypothetical protein